MDIHDEDNNGLTPFVLRKKVCFLCKVLNGIVFSVVVFFFFHK